MRAATHLAPGCPWHALSELRLPNVDWCEAQRCAWIVEPANTWSNLAYVAVGIALWWIARGSPSRALRSFGPAAVVVGVCSFVYHASYNFVLQVLDFFGMYVFCYLLLTLNLRRLGRLAPGAWSRSFGSLVAGTTALTVGIDFLEVPIQGLVFLLIVAIAASELRVRRMRGPYPWRWFAVALAAIGSGAVFSVLDVTRTWCEPANPVLQGHAIWHVLSALSLFAAYFHYRQFEGELL